nr:PEP-CTERM sorting domain-containing protein [uncultured Rhodopila sp.]
MRLFPVIVFIAWAFSPALGNAAPVGYSLTVTTAYANGNPFANQIDTVFSEPDTGFIEIANTGETTFSGIVGTIGVSAFAGDLSFASGSLVLAPGAIVSIAMPDNSASVGGFNGPAYYYRPGVEIYLDGTLSDGIGAEAVNLQVADREIHSGVWRTDSYGLASDSFVLQGGDPWGFDSGNAFAMSQANGVYVFSQAVPEPGSVGLLAAALAACAAARCTAGRRLRFPLA